MVYGEWALLSIGAGVDTQITFLWFLIGTINNILHHCEDYGSCAFMYTHVALLNLHCMHDGAASFPGPIPSFSIVTHETLKNWGVWMETRLMMVCDLIYTFVDISKHHWALQLQLLCHGCCHDTSTGFEWNTGESLPKPQPPGCYWGYHVQWRVCELLRLLIKFNNEKMLKLH